MEAIDALKQKVLSLAIQGKLVAQDPTDEPASVLLEKIKAEKLELIKQGKIKKDKQESYIFRGDDNKYYEQIGTETKDITEEIPFDIPNNWEWVRFKDLFNIVSSKRVLQSDWKMEGIPFYRAREIAKLSDFGFVKNELYISEDLFVELSKSYLMPEENDIMVSAVGTIGKAYIVKATDRFYYKDASVLCYKNISKIIPKYVKLFMESECFVSQYSKDSGGTTVDTLTIVRANQYLIPLPPIKEQEQIVSEIEKIFNQIEIVKENQEELNKLKDGLKNKVLDLAIQGKLVEQDPNDEPASVLLEKIKKEKAELIKQGKIKKDKQESYIYKGTDNRHYEKIGSEVRDITDEIPFEIPNSWSWVRLSTIGNIVSGGTPKTEVNENWENGTIPWLTPADMRYVKGKYVKHGERFITEYGLNSSSATMMPKNSIVYSSRAPIGYIAITENELCTNQGFKSITPYSVEFVDYLYYTLIALTDSIISRASGTTFKEISGSEFAKTIIPLPPLSEQKRIVEKLENVFQFIKTL